MTPSFRQRNPPILTLLLLAPAIAEVLPGASRLSAIFVLPTEIGVWGCAALLLLGIALAVAEECIIQQTSLAPLVAVDPARAYGRAFGVNWVYLLWALGYESAWAVILPVYLTERIFPGRREDPWIGKRGVIIVSALLLLSAFVAWFSWTQVAREAVFHLIGHALARTRALAVRHSRPQPGRTLVPDGSAGMRHLVRLPGRRRWRACPGRRHALVDAAPLRAACPPDLEDSSARAPWTCTTNWLSTSSRWCC